MPSTETIAKVKSVFLPIQKMSHSSDPKDLRERLVNHWSNMGFLAAFLAAVSVGFALVESNDSRKGDVFIFINSVSFILLTFVTVVNSTLVTTANFCPESVLPDIVQIIAPLEIVPFFAFVSSALLMSASIPIFVYEALGDGVYFVSILLITSLAIVLALITLFGCLYLQIYAFELYVT